MADGFFKTWNAAGVRQFSSADRLGRLLGSQWVNGVAGSIDQPGLDAGEPFTIFYPATWSPQSNRCVVSINGITITWSFINYGNFSSANNPSGWLFFGIR